MSTLANIDQLHEELLRSQLSRTICVHHGTYQFVPTGRAETLITAYYVQGSWRIWSELRNRNSPMQPARFDASSFGSSDAEARRLCDALGEAFPTCMVEVWSNL
jgi:hypothetical protein